MAHDILQSFLTARLFDVNGDDQRLDKLREAAEDLTKVIKAAPQRTAALTMVAIDAKVDANEPILAEVAKILEKRWNSFAGAFADTTLPVVIRAIILDALARSIGSEPIAAAVALTARTFLPQHGSVPDVKLWSDLLSDAEQRIESRARREWAAPAMANIADELPKVPPLPAISHVSIKRDWISERLAAAVGPSDEKGTAITGANPHWTNSAPAWSYDFTKRMAKLLGDGLDFIAKENFDRLNEQIANAYRATALTEYVDKIGNQMAMQAKGLERRSSLLWWKEALYSPALKSSYRSLDPANAAAWMAADAADITGAFAPRMAEAFLSETVRSLDPVAASIPVLLTDLGAALQADGERSNALAEALAVVTVESGRTPLASLLGHGVKLDAESLEARLGLPAGFKISPIDLALWLYRDLQAARATAGSSRSRRKGGAA